MANSINRHYILLKIAPPPQKKLVLKKKFQKKMVYTLRLAYIIVLFNPAKSINIRLV